MAEQEWERLPEETDKQYAAFCQYREMGPRDRSIAKVAASDGLTPGHYEVWSREKQWVARARAYDEHLERIRRRESEDSHSKELEEFRKRRKNFAAVGTSTATLMLQLLNQRLKADVAEMEEKVKSDARYKPPIDKSIPSWVRAASAVSMSSSEAEGDAIGLERLAQLLEEDMGGEVAE